MAVQLVDLTAEECFIVSLEGVAQRASCLDVCSAA
jgi:hypothetical protein